MTKRGTGDVAGASIAVDTDGTVVIAGASGFVDTEGTVVIAGASGFVDTDGTVAIAGVLCQALVRVWGLRQWRCHKSSMLPDREKEGF